MLRQRKTPEAIALKQQTIEQLACLEASDSSGHITKFDFICKTIFLVCVRILRRARTKITDMQQSKKSHEVMAKSAHYEAKCEEEGIRAEKWHFKHCR